MVITFSSGGSAVASSHTSLSGRLSMNIRAGYGFLRGRQGGRRKRLVTFSGDDRGDVGNVW